MQSCMPAPCGGPVKDPILVAKAQENLVVLARVRAKLARTGAPCAPDLDEIERILRATIAQYS
jgi:hypothetical protein